MDQSNEIINKQIHDFVDNSFKKIKKYVDKTIEQFQDASFDKELILENSKRILFNEQLCILLMEELVRERILSNEKIDILTKRASIRTKKLEK
jgi:hypothetical protein